VTRKPLKYIARGQQIDLEPGELIFGRKKLSMELRLSDRSVRTCLQHLEAWGNLTIRSTNRFSILKVTNWETYQELESQIDQQNDQEVTSTRPESDQQTTTKQEVKNVKNVKNKDMVARRRQIPSDFVLSPELKEFAAKNGCNGDRVGGVFSQFCDYHRAKGNTMLDWNAAWRTWIRNDKKFNSKPKYNQGEDVEEWIKRNS
jgi:hypothetical protein